MYNAELPARICKYISSVHSARIDSGKDSLLTRLTVAIASPEPTPGAMLPLIAAEVYRLYRVTEIGPPTSRTSTSVPIGTICPHLFRTCNKLISLTWLRYFPST